MPIPNLAHLLEALDDLPQEDAVSEDAHLHSVAANVLASLADDPPDDVPPRRGDIVIDKV
jgi:hypothetical protein